MLILSFGGIMGQTLISAKRKRRSCASLAPIPQPHVASRIWFGEQRVEIITHPSAKWGNFKRKKLQTFTERCWGQWTGAITWEGERGEWAGGEWEGNKRLNSSYNQSHLFPTINQLFSTPQVPHFPLPNSFYKLCCAWATLFFGSHRSSLFIIFHDLLYFITSHESNSKN